MKNGMQGKVKIYYYVENQFIFSIQNMVRYVLNKGKKSNKIMYLSLKYNILSNKVDQR